MPGRDLREFTHPEEWKAEQEAKRNAGQQSDAAHSDE
jgi:hypothetical protein